MKYIYLLILLFLTATIGYSQSYVPEGINYQAVVYDEENLNPGLDAKDFVLRNQNVSIRFTIIETTVNGNEVFQETHTTKTDNFGLFSIIIGKGTQISSNAFSAITWGKTAHFLKVEIDKKGESNYINMGVQELWSVPYSLSTKYAENAGNGIIAVSDNGDGTMTFDYQNGSKYTTPKLVGLTGPKGDIGLTGAQGVQGVKGDTGAQGVAGVDGTNGKNSLVNTTIEAAGANCTTGGTKIEYGLDANKDGILDASEIDATLTKYLCNGAQGTPGSLDAWSLLGNTSTDSTINFIGTTDDKPVVFKMNNDEKMRISGNGNVGFGTATPQAKVHIKMNKLGTALILESPYAPLRLKALNDGCYAEFYTPAYQNSNSRAAYLGFPNISSQDYQITNQTNAGAIKLGTKNLNRMTIDSSGNVGIGTSNPDNKLHLNESLAYAHINSNPMKSQFSIHASGSGQRLLMGSYYTGGVGSGSAIQSADFFNNKDNPTKLVLQPIGGNVGIGTASPLGKFHVNNDVIGSDSSFVVTTVGKVGIGTSNPGSKFTVINTNPSDKVCSNSVFAPILNANQTANLHSQWNEINIGSPFNFNCNLYGAVNRILGDAAQTGNVNLAIGASDDIIHNGSGTINSASGARDNIWNGGSGIIVNAFGSSHNVINYGTGSITNGYGVYIGNVEATNKWSLYASDASAPSYFSGNVGIGTTSPARKLHVSDVMRLEPIPTAPSSPAEGDIYYDSVLKKLRVFDGTTWQSCW